MIINIYISANREADFRNTDQYELGLLYFKADSGEKEGRDRITDS